MLLIWFLTCSTHHEHVPLAMLVPCLSNCSFADCDNNLSNGCEVNLMTDVNNCGGCGQVATFPNANAICSNGQAIFSSCLTG
jgi:hypothetical protein